MSNLHCYLSAQRRYQELLAHLTAEHREVCVQLYEHVLSKLLHSMRTSEVSGAYRYAVRPHPQGCRDIVYFYLLPPKYSDGGQAEVELAVECTQHFNTTRLPLHDPDVCAFYRVEVYRPHHRKLLSVRYDGVPTAATLQADLRELRTNLLVHVYRDDERPYSKLPWQGTALHPPGGVWSELL